MKKTAKTASLTIICFFGQSAILRFFLPKSAGSEGQDVEA